MVSTQLKETARRVPPSNAKPTGERNKRRGSSVLGTVIIDPVDASRTSADLEGIKRGA